MRTNRLAVLVAAALGATVVAASGIALAETRAAACSPGGPDFNGDGCVDLAVADPDATVDGKAQAGRINVLYGGDLGARDILTQAMNGTGETLEAGDRFGAVIRAAQINDDGYADLVVGVPSESVSFADDAGVIQVIFGAPDGLGKGQPGLVLQQGVWGVPGTPEAGDRFGASIAANTTGGEADPMPAVAFGVPGENVGSVADAGAAGLVTFDRATGEPAAVAAITQNSAGISGSVEAGDQFGAAVEVFQGPGGFFCDVTGVKGFTLVVGVPGEDISGVTNAGMVHVSRNLAADAPLTQNTAGVSGVAEAGDRFGASVALTSFCEHDGPSHITLAVGVPREDIGSVSDAGAVHLFRTDDDELPLPELWSVSQNTAGVDGTAEAGDRFGSALALGGPWRDAIGQPVLVSAAGEDIGTAADAGAVQIFGDITPNPGDGDLFLSQSAAGADPQAGDHFGAALVTRHDYLYIGAPDDVAYRSGVVHGIPWESLFGGPESHLIIAPGQDGVPSGASRFGAGLA